MFPPISPENDFNLGAGTCWTTGPLDTSAEILTLVRNESFGRLSSNSENLCQAVTVGGVVLLSHDPGIGLAFTLKVFSTFVTIRSGEEEITLLSVIDPISQLPRSPSTSHPAG